MKSLFDYIFYTVCVSRGSKSLYRLEIRCNGVSNPGIRMTKIVGVGPSSSPPGADHFGNYLHVGENLVVRYEKNSLDGGRNTSRIALLATDEGGARTALGLPDLVPMDPRFEVSTKAVLARLAQHEYVD